MIEDGEQANGAVTTVVRIGEPAVHALLGHLHQGGFDPVIPDPTAGNRAPR